MELRMVRSCESGRAPQGQVRRAGRRVRALEEMQARCNSDRGSARCNDLIPRRPAVLEPTVAIPSTARPDPSTRPFYPFRRFLSPMARDRFGLRSPALRSSIHQANPTRWARARDRREPDADGQAEDSTGAIIIHPLQRSEEKERFPLSGSGRRIRREPLKWMAEAAGL